MLKIIKVPNDILKQKSAEIKDNEIGLKELAADMAETMYANKGVGLAGVQVGILKRIIIIDVDYKNNENEIVPRNTRIFLNPVITWESAEKELMEEGCLSVPGEREKVIRHLEIEVEYQDLDFKKHTLRTGGFLAHCLQHEIDHTNGIVYLNYLSKIKRDMIIKRQKKCNYTTS